MSELVVKAATGPEPDAVANMRAASRLAGLVRLRQLPEHEGSCVIVAGGPSAADHVDDIGRLADEPLNLLCSINCMHSWLHERGLHPNIHVIFEPDVDVYQLLGMPRLATAYYVCSQCPPRIFRALDGHRVVLWHYWDIDVAYDRAVAELFPGEFMIGGGYPTLFRTMNIAIMLGYREFDLFGVDCSFTDDEHQHVAGYPTRPEMAPVDYAYDGKTYRTLGALVLQAEMIEKFCAEAREVRVRVHGSGLLPSMMKRQRS